MGISAAPGDLLITKNRYSAFHGTNLNARLRALGVDSVTICGVTTRVCVEGKARDAAQHDYLVTVVADASAKYQAGDPGPRCGSSARP